MNTISKNVRRNWLSGILALTAFLFILFLPAAVQAADYAVWGRVYSATPLGSGEALPENPLSDEFTGNPERIVGKGLVPHVSRNLVKVRVIKASDNSELGHYLVSHDGGYLISFSAGIDASIGGISIRFIVEEMATGVALLRTDPLTLSPSVPNIRYLLVPVDVLEIDSGIEYAFCPVPGKNTAIFTRVGKIEVATEVGGSPYDLIGSNGLANVPPVVATDLHIPQYQDAPFGGNLFLFGALSKKYYYSGLLHQYYYRIRIDQFQKGIGYVFFKYMDAPLKKTKYTVNFTTGKVDTARVTLGPRTVKGIDNCYAPTPIAVSSDVFWSFPDLLALWPTGGLNGKYQLTLEVIDLPILGPPVPDPPPLEATFQAVDQTDLTLCLDNVRPDADILELCCSAGDTPLVYSPPPDVTGGKDFRTTMLGGASNYADVPNAKCSILNLTKTKDCLAFKLTGYHQNGHLRYWYFKYKRNDGGYQMVIGKKYNGTTDLMEDYVSGMPIAYTMTDDHGFQDMYLYLNKDYLGPESGGCAYRFVIGAATRTTDGYHYLRYDWDEDLHYIDR